MNRLKVLELFAGIGACSSALERLGIEHEIVDAVEIDKYAIKSFNAIHGTNFETQDITTWDKDIEVDLIMHGSPCQDFSLAGKQAGGDKDSGTRSSLMYETLRIVEKLKPKYVIWENVKNILSQKHRHNFAAYLEKMNELGYVNYYQVLNAKDYGIPQNRERVFTVSILDESYCNSWVDSEPYYDEKANNFYFPSKQELKLKLKDLLEDEVDEKYYLSDKMMNYCLGLNQKESNYPRGERFLQNINRNNQDIANTISTNAGNRPVDNFIKEKDGFITQDAYLPIKNATKKGYLEAYEGDSVNLEHPNSKTRRGRVGYGVSQTLTTSCNQGIIIGSTQKHAAISKDGIIPTLTSAMGQGGGHVPMHNYDLRIRKLTPKECWRLMGFSDEDFEKAEKVNSNTQLYKQAGNSIVVNVLMEIFKKLFDKEDNNE